MFAEDRGLLPNLQFTLALDACRGGQSSYDVLGNLFGEMNTPGTTAGGQFKGTPYFNGGIFAHIPRLELLSDELELLSASAKENWQRVRPSIFGNIFEASSDDATRHAHGQHFTSEVDMLQIIRPTIVEPWEERIEKASTFAELEGLRQALIQYRGCDPAYGSGNFLYMSYNAVKDLEVSILRRIEERRTAKKEKDQLLLGLVTPLQFFGMDISPFVVELARVTLMIARKVANDRLGLTEMDLPLDNLDNNIRVADAYVRNPPFLGGKRLREGLGHEYVECLYSRFPDSANFADICCYWFQLAHDNLSPDGNAGLVATNMIRRINNRKASLEYIAGNGGHIHTPVTSQPWLGEANVHVSIVNWSRREPVTYLLDGDLVSSINTSLKAGSGVGATRQLQANLGRFFIGVQPTGKGLEVATEVAEKWIASDSETQRVTRQYLIAKDMTTRPLGKASKWIIDFNELTLEEADQYAVPFDQVVRLVRPQRMKVRRQAVAANWWRLQERRPAMRAAIAREGGYFCMPRVSKWYIPLKADVSWLPGISYFLSA